MYGVTFSVSGNPVPQPRPRVSTWGGRARAYVPADHPIHAYRLAISMAAKAAAAACGHAQTKLPVMLEVVLVFQRPPSHLRKSGGVKPSAPAFPPKADWDNCGKGVSDAITDSAAIWHDDDQVVQARVVKRYAEHGEPARTMVLVRPLEDGQ